MNLPARRLPQGRPRGALFVCLWLAAGAAGAAGACPADRVDLRAGVEYVHDGDTLRLADGRSLRLIGLDTPELARDGRHAEPLAETARDRLRVLLRAAGMRLDLQYDTEREDRYGRSLAHAYLPDGRNLTALLLEEGLASTLVVPPNLRWWTCYREAERRARAAGRGLWALPGHRVHEAATLDPALRGFVLVRGRVRERQPRRAGVRLLLDGGLVVWSGRADLAYFPAPERLVGQRVEVRGMLRQRGDERQIRVRHPAALAGVDAGKPERGHDDGT